MEGGKRQSPVLSDLPDGLYYCTLRDSFPSDELAFYKGDAATLFQEYRKRSAPMLNDPNVGALITRYEHLNKAENKQPTDRIWQAKIVGTFTEWNEVLNSVEHHKDAYVDVPGTHTRGFRSPVDGQVQHYLVHVPASYKREAGPIPLVVVVPYFEAPLRPFLESFRVASIGNNHEFSAAADENGFAYLMLNNRGNTFGSDFGEADMFAAIEQVKHDYAIDPSRIYLFGSCSGGREALALAAKYPDSFAAVGLVSPEAEFNPVAPLRPTDPMAVVWLNQKTPLTNMANLVNIPVYDIHGDEDDHTPLKYSYELRDAAKHAGVDFQLEVVAGAGQWEFPVDPMKTIFKWFAQYRLKTNPDHVVLTTTQMRYNRAYWAEIAGIADPLQEASLEARYRNGTVTVEARNVRSYVLKADLLRQKTAIVTVTTDGEESFDGPLTSDIHVQIAGAKKAGIAKTQQVGGPLSDVFTGPFLVVVGTSGGADRTKANADFANFFKYTWKQRYFVDCPVKKDSEVSDDDIRSEHLLLIGDAESNTLIERMSAKLPFRMRDGKMQAAGRSYEGDGVVAQYVYPNPLNPRRYIAVLGVPPCLKCPADATQLTLKGWYDFAVWKWDGTGKATLLDIGRFDQDWMMPPTPAKVAATLKGQ